MDCSSFDRDRHLLYLEMMLEALPWRYQDQEINRVTLAYFVISAFDLLGALDRVDKRRIVDWVLSLQALLPREASDVNNGEFYGFHGSRSSQFPQGSPGVVNLNGSHLASTYCALAILRIVGHTLQSVDYKPILISMKNLQLPDGSVHHLPENAK